VDLSLGWGLNEEPDGFLEPTLAFAEGNDVLGGPKGPVAQHHLQLERQRHGY